MNLLEAVNNMSINEFVDLLAEAIIKKQLNIKPIQELPRKLQLQEKKDIYTPKDIMKLLQISRPTLWRYINEGKFPSPAFEGKRWSYKQIQKFLDTL